MLLKLFFWINVIIIVYVYLGYFCILEILTFVFKKEIYSKFKAQKCPFISVIIAAYNEEKVIKKRIENLLQQDYPKDKLEIIVASDGSTDRTVEIAKQFEKYGVKVLDFKENRGRAAVHNDAAKVAKGEILIFTDAETEFEKDFVQKIVKMYSIPEFGVGAGELVFRSPKMFGETESIYWKMEKKLRYYEYLLGILPFASGACFSIRKKLYEEIPLHSDIDNVLPLRAIQKGYKVFYCKNAVAYDYTVSTPKDLFRKRYRTALRSMTDILIEIPGLIKSKKFGILFILFSHRLLRWWSSPLFPLLFFLNLKLLKYGLMYQIIFGCQMAFYILVVLGALQRITTLPQPLSKISNTAYSFILANIAFVFATFSFLIGKKISVYRN